MAYKFTPSAAQKAAYRAAMIAAESHTFVEARGPIRTGCGVTWFDVTTAGLLSGVVERHSYGAERNQHTFSIRLESGELKLVKGRNLYPRLTNHTPGDESRAAA